MSGDNYKVLSDLKTSAGFSNFYVLDYSDEQPTAIAYNGEEVMTSAIGAASGSGAMAYGNAIGSIICNTSLIAAITIAIKPSKADRKPMIVPVCFFFAARRVDENRTAHLSVQKGCRWQAF